LINLPANDLGPSDLAAALSSLGRVHKAEVSIIIFPVLAVLFAAFHFRHREVKYPVDGRRGLQ